MDVTTLIDVKIVELIGAILAPAIIFLAVCLVFMAIKADRLTRLNTVFSERLLLYKMFNDNVSVVKMLKIIDTVRTDSIDSDEISLRLKKYFNKSFRKFKILDIAMILRDIESNKHSAFIMSVFVKAKMPDILLPGKALFRAITNCNEREIEILNRFLEKIPLDKKTEQLKFAVMLLNEFFEDEMCNQISSECRTLIEGNRDKLQQRIEIETE